MIRRLPHVDRVGVEERAAQLGRRSIKTTAKQQGIRGRYGRAEDFSRE